MNPQREEAGQLLTAGLRDRTAFRILRRDAESPAEITLFHAQQAAEKFIKAVLALRGVTYRRTHDLVELNRRPPGLGRQTHRGGATLTETSMIRIFAVAFAALAAVCSGGALAQAWPSKPIKIVVPYTAGGSSDFTARTLAERLGPLLSTQVVVENKPGGNTVIGTEYVVKSPADGYTLLLAGLTTYGAQPHLNKKLPYDVLKDLTPINNAIISPLVLSVNPGVPVKNVQELVAYAKANPGKVNYGSAGVGNTLHLATELFKMKTGVIIVDVPYKGASQAVVDLLAGNIQMMFDLVQTPLQHIRAGNLRALGTTWDKRASALPDVPTLIEQGLDYNFGAMIGLMGPAGMPKEVVNRLHAEIAKVMAMAEVREAFAKQAMEPALFASPEAYAAAFRNEVDNMGRLVRAAGIQPQ